MEILTNEQYYSKDLTIEAKRKYCYELCKSVNFKKRDLLPYAEKYECVPATLFLNAKRYALTVLGMTEEEFAKDAGLRGTRYVDLIEKLLRTGDPKEIRKLLSEEGLNLTFLSEKIKEYPRIHYKNLTPEQQDNMVRNLSKKVNFVVEEQKKLKRQELLKEKQLEIRLNDIKRFEVLKEKYTILVLRKWI